MGLKNWFSGNKGEDLNAQLEREARIAHTQGSQVAHAGAVGNVETDPDQLEATVRQLVAEGKAIAAVKAYRDATGVGLKEAKDAVDRIAQHKAGGW